MDKKDVAHIYNGILLSHKKNEIELFVVRWMELDSVIQSEIIQKEKKQMQYANIYIYMASNGKKKGNEEASGRTGIKTHTY